MQLLIRLFTLLCIREIHFWLEEGPDWLMDEIVNGYSVPSIS